jgi:hypothetical protein
MACHREVYPGLSSAAAKAHKAEYQRVHQRRKTQALRVLRLLGGPPLGV